MEVDEQEEVSGSDVEFDTGEDDEHDEEGEINGRVGGDVVTDNFFADDEEEFEEDGEGDEGGLRRDSFEPSEQSEEGGQTDFTCQVCGHNFADITNLFAHLESHKSGDYDSFAECAVPDQHCYGDPKENTRKWPNRFLKPNTPALESEFENPTATLNGTEHESSESDPNSDTDIDLQTPSELPVLPNGSVEQEQEEEEEEEEPEVNPIVPTEVSVWQRYTCPQCLKRFRRSDHFRQHLINHEGGNAFHCTICGQQFDVVIALRRHMITHEDYMPFRCSRCPRRFQNAVRLKEHEASHGQITEHSRSDDSSLIKRIAKRKCRVCVQSFGSEALRVEHERRMHGPAQQKIVLRCRYTACREVCPTLKLLIQHYKDKHGAERLLEAAKALQNQPQGQSSSSQSTPVSVNGLGSDDESSVGKRGGANDGPPLLSAEEGFGECFSDEKMGGVSMEEEEGTVECRMCFRFLSSISQRNVHETAVHDINNPLTVLQCKYSNCKKILGAKNWLARHIREHRERINHGIEMESQEDLRALSKALNGEGAEEEESAHAHSDIEQMEVSEEEDCECRLCGQRFVCESERSAHEDRLHDTGNPSSEFLCRICQKEVGNFFSLLTHMDKTHGKSKGKRKRSNSMQKPPKLTKENSNVNYVFPCRHCDLTFPDQHTRVIHEYDVHATRDALDSPFPCKVCDKVMTLRSLRNHLRKIHGLNTVIQVTSDTPNIDEPVNPMPTLPRKITLEKPISSKKPAIEKPVSATPSKKPDASWMCRLCFDQFDEQRQRETHEHAVHGTNSPNATYVCKYSECIAKFDTFRALIKHLRDHGETTFPKGQQKLPTPSLTQYKQHM